MIHDESDASSYTSFSSEWSNDECVSGPSVGMEVTPYQFEPEPSTDNHNLPQSDISVVVEESSIDRKAIPTGKPIQRF